MSRYQNNKKKGVGWYFALFVALAFFPGVTSAAVITQQLSTGHPLAGVTSGSFCQVLGYGLTGDARSAGMYVGFTATTTFKFDLLEYATSWTSFSTDVLTDLSTSTGNPGWQYSNFVSPFSLDPAKIYVLCISKVNGNLDNPAYIGWWDISDQYPNGYAFTGITNNSAQVSNPASTNNSAYFGATGDLTFQLLSSTSTTGTSIDGGTIIIGSIEFPPRPATTTCNIISDFVGCVQNVVVFLFYPSQGAFDQIFSIKDLLIAKPPVGYFYVVTAALVELNASSTPAFTLLIPVFIKDNYFLLIDSTLSLVLLLWFVAHFYKRLKELHLW